MDILTALSPVSMASGSEPCTLGGNLIFASQEHMQQALMYAASRMRMPPLSLSLTAPVPSSLAAMPPRGDYSGFATTPCSMSSKVQLSSGPFFIADPAAVLNPEGDFFKLLTSAAPAVLSRHTAAGLERVAVLRVPMDGQSVLHMQTEIGPLRIASGFVAAFPYSLIAHEDLEFNDVFGPEGFKVPKGVRIACAVKPLCVTQTVGGAVFSHSNQANHKVKTVTVDSALLEERQLCTSPLGGSGGGIGPSLQSVLLPAEGFAPGDLSQFGFDASQPQGPQFKRALSDGAFVVGDWVQLLGAEACRTLMQRPGVYVRGKRFAALFSAPVGSAGPCTIQSGFVGIISYDLVAHALLPSMKACYAVVDSPRFTVMLRVTDKGIIISHNTASKHSKTYVLEAAAGAALTCSSAGGSTSGDSDSSASGAAGRAAKRPRLETEEEDEREKDEDEDEDERRFCHCCDSPVAMGEKHAACIAADYGLDEAKWRADLYIQ